MGVKINATCLKCAYQNGSFRILNWSPIDKPKGLKLSKYFTFSTKGDDSYITVGRDYEIEIELISEDSRYGGTYKIISCPSVGNLEFDKMTYDEKFEVIMECTSSTRIAENILEAYPNFIELVLTQGKEAIDIKKIKGVGDSYLNAYTRELNEKYKYIKLKNELSDYKIDIKDCKTLLDKYSTQENAIAKVTDNPYEALISVLGRSFELADKTIIEVRKDLLESEIRCVYLILSVLEQNEQATGSTKCNANDVYFYLIENCSQGLLLKDKIVPSVLNNPNIFYYDQETQELAIRETYLAECKIAEFVKRKLDADHFLDIDIEQYRQINDNPPLSDDQMKVLENFCKYDISILAGYAGCVDKDTEYFNGKEWKSINHFQEGEKVLQWNRNGIAELVYPMRYIAEPCAIMYHFTSTSGIDQMLSAEHRVVTEKDGEFHIRTAQEIYAIHQNEPQGFRENYITSFSYSGQGSYLTDNELLSITDSLNFTNKDLYNCSLEQFFKIYNRLIFNSAIYLEHGNTLGVDYDTCINVFDNASADFVQFLLSSLNYNTTIERHAYNLYTIRFNKKTVSSFCMNIEQVLSEDGMKYCFQVPSSYLILRRKGHIFVTGNCGKSFAVNNLIKLMDDCGLTYTLLSPTGKASKVLSKYTNRAVSTIHKRCFSGSINTDVIIVDEMSMVSLDVFVMLLNSIENQDCKVLLIGDPKQIPSIQKGRVFDDIITSNLVPMVELTKVFRYKDDDNLYVATNAREGKPFDEDENRVKVNGNTYTVGKNFKFIDCEDIDDILDTLYEEYNKLIKKNVKPQDISVLTCYNIKELGTARLNNLIQKEINPIQPNEPHCTSKAHNVDFIFKVNDIIMWTKNDYHVATYEDYIDMKESDGKVTLDDIEGVPVMNGETGIIREIVDDGKGFIAQFDERLVYVPKMQFSKVLLAYSCTIHKKQGDSSPYIIWVLHEQHSKMMYRELLYVATTRSSNKNILIGSLNAFNQGLKKVALNERNTFLVNLLNETIDKDKEM